MGSVYTAEFCIACMTVTTDKMTHTFIPSWSMTKCQVNFFSFSIYTLYSSSFT